MHRDVAAILRHLGARIFQQALHGANVFHLRNAMQNHRLIGEQAGGQNGERGIL